MAWRKLVDGIMADEKSHTWERLGGLLGKGSSSTLQH